MPAKKPTKNLGTILLETFAEEDRAPEENSVDPHSLPSEKKLESTLVSLVGTLQLETAHAQEVLLDIIDEPLPETVRLAVLSLRKTLSILETHLTAVTTQTDSLVKLYKKEAAHRNRPVISKLIKRTKV